MPNRIAVSSAEFIRNIGRWQQEALQHPIVITHHGRERLVLASPDKFRADAANDAAADPDATLALRSAHAALLAHMEDGCLSFGQDGTIIAANPAAAEFLAVPAEELAGRQLPEVLPDLLALIVMDRVMRVSRTRSAEQFEADAADGRHLRFRAYASPQGVTVVFRNATEMVRLQRELEECRGLTNAAQRHSQVAVLKLDARGRLDAIDDVFCVWTGFTQAELRGHRLAELVAGSERRELTVLVDRVLHQPGSDQIRVEVLGRAGASLVCELTLAPIMSDFVPCGVMVLAAPAPTFASARAPGAG